MPPPPTPDPTQDRHEAELAEVRRRCALEAEEARRRSGAEAEEARGRADAEVEAVRRRCEAELEDMRRRLRSEKNLRRACEKWLRSELKSRVRARGQWECELACTTYSAWGQAWHATRIPSGRSRCQRHQHVMPRDPTCC